MYPFFMVLLVLLALVTYWPTLTLWLPRTMGV
jgi:C4-dicarboxylate transporter DctM subunit